MNGRESRALGWLQTVWGLLAMVVLIVIILLILWYVYPREPTVVSRTSPAPSQAVAECDRQLSSSTFRIDGWTAHERFLADYPVPTSKRPLYVYVVFKKSSYSFGGPVQQTASVANVRMSVARPSDLNHQSNMSAEGECVLTQQKPSGSTTDSAYAEERWSTYCDLSRYQDESQEQETGLAKYRVRVENASDEAVDYCFVASCDVRYPSGKPCSAPAGAGSPYGGSGYGAPGGYSAPSSSGPPGYSAPGYSAPAASAPPAAVPATTSGQ